MKIKMLQQLTNGNGRRDCSFVYYSLENPCYVTSVEVAEFLSVATLRRT